MNIFSKPWWCSWTHGGGDIKRDEQGRINWQCRKCKRWADNPVTLTDEEDLINNAIKGKIK